MNDTDKNGITEMTVDVFSGLEIGDYLKHSRGRGGHLVLSRKDEEVTFSDCGPCRFESGFIVDADGDQVNCLMLLDGIETVAVRTERMNAFIEMWNNLEVGDALVIGDKFSTILHQRDGFNWLSDFDDKPNAELFYETPLRWDPELAMLTDRSGNYAVLNSEVTVEKGKGAEAAAKFAETYQAPSMFFTMTELNDALNQNDNVDKIKATIENDPTFRSIDTLALLCDQAFGPGNWTLEQLAIFAGGIGFTRHKANSSSGNSIIDIIMSAIGS